MCGICGEVRFDDEPASWGAVEAMARVLAPRGPDGVGAMAFGRVALGHRRLSIIDLSARSNQPLFDGELGLAVVHNGEIYNYRELRAELAGMGYRFFSEGDAEVVLKAWHAWGDAFVDRLQGMFATALWERDSGRVVLARDRLGIRPLYVAEVPGGLRFASSLPALVAAGGVDTAIDPVALHHYMTFHSVVPPPRTLLAGVRKVPPATVRNIEPDGRTRDRHYWTVAFEPRPGDDARSADDWKAAVLEALRTAVRRRLVADVPVGVLLSGGLDSSLVVGLLAEEGQAGLRTFSIGFESIDDEAGDEFRYSDLVAERFGTDHTRIFIPSDRALGALDDAVRAMSEPMVSHDNIGFHLLSAEVSKHVRVVQSGQGADEVFAGYHWYPPLLDGAHPETAGPRMARRRRSGAQTAERRAIHSPEARGSGQEPASGCQLDSRDAVRDYARVFFDRDHAEYARTVHPRFVGEDWSTAFVAEHFGRPGAPRPIDKALRLDTTVMLMDDPVKRVDNQTMAWGLEARVPFLDHELVELAARVPAEMKVRGGGKWILKEAARSVIPHEVIDRPKGYFPVPALKYLRGAFLDRVRDVLGAPAARARALFRAEALDAWLHDPDAHLTPLRGSKLWQAALLEYWLQVHDIRAA